jgi:hypothetical protein
MNYAFELYVSKSEVTTKDFSELYMTTTGYIGLLAKIRFHIKLSNNNLRYFIEADKDLSVISGSIPFGVLKPVSLDEVALPLHTSRERFVNFVKGGSVIDLHEKFSVKRGKHLEHFVCDVVRVTATKAKVDIKLYFKNAGDEWSLASKMGVSFPAHLFAVDLKKANNFMKKEIPKYLNIEKALTWLSPEDTNAVLKVDTFPYTSKPYYLNLANYEFDKHSMIVGASGSGKSKFIQLLIDRIQKLPNSDDYRIALIDPHANLADEMQQIIPNGSLEIVDFGSDSAELFAGAEADVTAATELTSSLFKSLMGDSFNPRVERVLRFSLFVLFTAKNMSMGTLKRFLIETELRNQILNHVDSHVPHNIVQFFNTDYNEVRTAHYNEGLLPIISLIDEMELQPTFLAEGGLSLQQSINNKFLTIFSLNKVSMGEKVVKTVAGLLIQQIFLLAQSKAFNQKVLLFIDEVSIVQTPALASILSEARKYNLFVFLTQQYFTQVEKGLQDAIFANVNNYYAFRVSEEDAFQIVGNLPMELPKDLAIKSKDEGLKQEELKTRFLTELSPRECIVRITAGGQLLPSIKAKTVDMLFDSSSNNKEVDLSSFTNPNNEKKIAITKNVTSLKAFKEAAPVTMDEFLERAEAAIDHYQENPSYDTTPREGENFQEYSNTDVSELLREQHPKAFDSLKDKTETVESKLKSPQSIAPTVIRFAMNGTPIVDRGMPDIASLLKQESTKTNVQ